MLLKKDLLSETAIKRAYPKMVPVFTSEIMFNTFFSFFYYEFPDFMSKKKLSPKVVQFNKSIYRRTNKNPHLGTENKACIIHKLLYILS